MAAVYKRTLFLFLTAFTIFTVEGCFTLNQKQKPLSAYFSCQAVVIEVPVILQENKKSCGIAAIDMLTWYYGVILNPTYQQILINDVEQNKSISGRSLKEALEKAGYKVAVFPGTLDKEPTGLYRHLNRKNPLIVLLRNEKEKVGHYCLVSGYDPIKDLIILSDPQKGVYGLSTKDFNEQWANMNNFTLLAQPPTDLFRK